MSRADDINDLKHQALRLRIQADERARALTIAQGAVAQGFEIRDNNMDAAAKFAEAVVRLLDPAGSGDGAVVSATKSGA